MILDEFILAGEIQETSKKARERWSSRDAPLRSATPPRLTHARLRLQVILERMEEQEKIESQDGGGLLDRLT
jgi:hypothetical protein